MVRLDSMESHSHSRSPSSSSASSFDSCSDLLASLDLPLKGSSHLVTPSEKQPQEVTICTEVTHAVQPLFNSENHGLEQVNMVHGILEKKICESMIPTLNQVELLRFKTQEASTEPEKLVSSEIKEIEAQNSVDHDVEEIPSSIAVPNSETLVDETVQESFQLQSSRLLDGSFVPESVDNGEECSSNGVESDQRNLDNEEQILGNVKPLQLQRDDGSQVFLPCRHLTREGTFDTALDGWPVQRSRKYEHKEDDLKPVERTKSVDGADPRSTTRLGDLKLDEDTTGMFTSKASLGDTALQVFIQDHGGEPFGHPVTQNANFSKVGCLKLRSSEHLLCGEAASQSLEQSDFHSIFREQIHKEGQDTNSAEDQYLSSSNIVFGQGDWDEFMHESLHEKACVLDQFSVSSKTGVLPGLIEGVTHVSRDPISIPNTEGLLAFSESNYELQQLEDSIRFFDLYKPSSVVLHPLRTLSSGSGRPDLEEVDEQVEVNGVVGRTFPCTWTASNQYSEHTVSLSAGLFTKNRWLAEGSIQPGDEDLNSADMLSTLESKGAITDNKGYISEGNQLQPYANERGMEGKYQPLLEEDLSADSPIKWKGTNLQITNRGWEEEDLGPDELSRYMETLDVNETYVDTVLDMEDVLLNSDQISRGRLLHAAGNLVAAIPRAARDGSLTSSTSGMQMLSLNHFLLGESSPFAVDWVEVVGAKQRKGGSSFGERMVGVKDHTVYCIKVVSGKEEWEVLRRYRDFVELYHQLKRIFNAHPEHSLPSVWEEVESESRKVFGNASPNIVEVRSIRIERCLQSLLQAGLPFSTVPPLFWFLRPKSIFGESHLEDHLSIQSPSPHKGSDVQLGALDSPQLPSPRSDGGSSRTDQDQERSSFILGKTIKLVVTTHPHKSLKQLLYAQHNLCAGCYKHLDLEKGLVQGFVQTLGWGKPRFCEYSGQLFCTSCHLNETAVLPAHVLQNWDFMPRRVSQLAKAYLDSIYDQPMLCVSAVNPHLYSRVPILAHIKETRTRLSKMISCLHCPLRARMQQTLSTRRYLLEDNGFFALRDLEDLSKGAFAVIPGLLTAIAENLKAHITKQCSFCQDTGEWCGAGILCDDPFSLIFPFQEDNVTSCRICHAPFHKKCFLKCTLCPSCCKDKSSKAIHAAESLDACKDELKGYGEQTTFPDGQLMARNASSSSLVGPDIQGSSTELDKASPSQGNWPFYNLLSKSGLW